ncbi:MAG TPA: Ada metal-binding domain-containing protein [Candidatus Saccharimonadales bacterium]|nr:Ada metal-binding domain-containing protein [Candidatus Saccharimonadales bacterium]
MANGKNTEELTRKFRYTAILSRDKRYDSHFVFAVKTTGIFCLPSCPAPRPLEKNVLFFANARAAQDAGFRACKRCNPNGSKVAIAGRSARHMRRLTRDTLGISPRQLQEAARLAAARELLLGTNLPIITVAFSADFSSLRQFNHVFKKAFAMTPTQMRASGQTRQMSAHATVLHLRLAYKRPFDWPPLVKGLLAHITPGLEQYDTATRQLTRHIEVAGAIAKVVIDLTDYGDHVNVTIEAPDVTLVDEVVRRVRRLLDLDHDPQPANAILSQDPALKPFVTARPGLRIVGSWDPYELMILTIIGQQISVPAARTIAGRLVAAYGLPHNGLFLFPKPATLAAADAPAMSRRIGIGAKKAAAIQGFAKLVADGMDMRDVASRKEITAQLLSIPGIGPWSVAYVALRGWGDPDAFPADDLLVKRMLKAATGRQAQAASDAWRPFRAYAAMHIWTGAAYV